MHQSRVNYYFFLCAFDALFSHCRLHNRKCALNHLCWTQGSLGQQQWRLVVLTRKKYHFSQSEETAVVASIALQFSLCTDVGRVRELCGSLRSSRRCSSVCLHMFPQNVDASTLLLTFNYRRTSILTSRAVALSAHTRVCDTIY